MSTSMVAALVDIRPDHHVAFAAEIGGEPVGIVRWIRLRGKPAHAEIAAEVVDAVQRCGLGRQLAAAAAHPTGGTLCAAEGPADRGWLRRSSAGIAAGVAGSLPRGRRGGSGPARRARPGCDRRLDRPPAPAPAAIRQPGRRPRPASRWSRRRRPPAQPGRPTAASRRPGPDSPDRAPGRGPAGTGGTAARPPEAGEPDEAGVLAPP